MSLSYYHEIWKSYDFCFLPKPDSKRPFLNYLKRELQRSSVKFTWNFTHINHFRDNTLLNLPSILDSKIWKSPLNSRKKNSSTQQPANYAQLQAMCCPRKGIYTSATQIWESHTHIGSSTIKTTQAIRNQCLVFSVCWLA